MAIRSPKPYAPLPSDRASILALLIDYHALVIEFRSSKPGTAEHVRLMAREQDLLRRIRELVGE
jgi:hypothetical protein